MSIGCGNFGTYTFVIKPNLSNIARLPLIGIFILACFQLIAQQSIFEGRIRDFDTDEPLPFVNITLQNTGTQSDSRGHFSLATRLTGQLKFSIVGYDSRSFDAQYFKNGSIVYLSKSKNELDEVLVRPGENPAWRIIREVRKNERNNNPLKYDEFKALSYTKIRLRADSLMYADTSGNGETLKGYFKLSKQDSLSQQDYLNLLMLENEGNFYFKKGQQKEVVNHSITNVPKFFPTNLIFTDEQNPIGFYQPFYKFFFVSAANTDGVGVERNYVNPIKNGTFGYYDFELTDTLFQDKDSVFVIQFWPFKKTQEALRGVLKINSNGYAIQEIIAENADTLQPLNIQIEQQYVFENRRWYPEKRTMSWQYPFETQKAKMRVRFTHFQYLRNFENELKEGDVYFDGSTKSITPKADTITFDQFKEVRPLILNEEEKKVYQKTENAFSNLPIIKKGIELMEKPSKWIMQASLPIGPFLLLLDQNQSNFHELVRGGLGLQNNLLENPRFGFRASAGFGLRDQTFKYRTSASWHITKDRYNRLSVYHVKDIRPPGQVSFLGPNYSTPYPQSLFFDRRGYIVDSYKLTGTALYVKPVRWTWFRFYTEKQDVKGLNYEIEELGKSTQSYLHYGVNMRFTRKERFVRNGFFENVVSNYFPIVAFNYGHFNGLNNSKSFQRFSFSITQQFRWKKLGYDVIKINGGQIWGDAPYNFLYNNLGGSRGFFGFSKPGFITGNFLNYASNRYIFLDYVHYFGKNLIKSKAKWFQPQVGVGHRFSWTVLDNKTRFEGFEIDSFKQGQFELDLYMNNLITIPLFGLQTGFGFNAAYNYSQTFEGKRRWVILPNVNLNVF
ncbi:DUF5686 family protein [Jiulongibacter sediminis]|uniref:DUF5686 family protein n=1 Tax=Jiulongibacter sediminis TaxID=1605367 RepID=UPI0026F13B7D|nr:DUF5686 family protein [Jiulongibacter sediminis]